MIVDKFSKLLEDETYNHQITKMVPHIFRLLDPRQTESIK